MMDAHDFPELSSDSPYMLSGFVIDVISMFRDTGGFVTDINVVLFNDKGEDISPLIHPFGYDKLVDTLPESVKDTTVCCEDLVESQKKILEIPLTTMERSMMGLMDVDGPFAAPISVPKHFLQDYWYPYLILSDDKLKANIHFTINLNRIMADLRKWQFPAKISSIQLKKFRKGPQSAMKRGYRL